MNSNTMHTHPTSSTSMHWESLRERMRVRLQERPGSTTTGAELHAKLHRMNSITIGA